MINKIDRDHNVEDVECWSRSMDEIPVRQSARSDVSAPGRDTCTERSQGHGACEALVPCSCTKILKWLVDEPVASLWKNITRKRSTICKGTFWVQISCILVLQALILDTSDLYNLMGM